LSRKTFFLTQHSEQEMANANMLVSQLFCFFGSVGKHALALITKRKIHRGWDLFPDHRMTLDLLADTFNSSLSAREFQPVHKGLVLAQNSQEQMFRFYIRAAEFGSLVAAKENYAAGFFCISLKHIFQEILFASGLLRGDQPRRAERPSAC